jgi:adenine phosphoribosyltransferase
MKSNMDLYSYVRDIPDFPKPGILFRDITPLLRDQTAFQSVINRMAEPYRDIQVDVIIAAEARGFIFAAPLAIELGAGFVPVRKPGKLPHDRYSFSYDLEYGRDTLEIHKDAIVAGQRVLVVDDLLATGGTVEACCKLLKNIDCEVVGCAFAIELEGLNGRARLTDYPVFSVLKY